MPRVPDEPLWRIREARPHEAPRLAEVAERLFRQGYADTHPEPALSEYVADSFNAERCRRILEDPACVALVVEDATGDWIGYAQLKDGSPAASSMVLAQPLPGERLIEIVRFYVDEAHHGRGVAQSLMAACDRAASARGRDAVWLQAWQEAARPLAFYRKEGFRECGVAKFLFAGVLEDDVLLARPVRQPSGSSRAPV